MGSVTEAFIPALRAQQKDPSYFLREIIDRRFQRSKRKRVLIHRADTLAEEAHAARLRDNGEPYTNHGRMSAMILIFGAGTFDELAIAAALNHDVVEDHGNGWLARIERELHPLVAETVQTCNIHRFDHIADGLERERAFLADICCAATQSRARRVKLAEQLHNAMTPVPEKLADHAWRKRKINNLRSVYRKMAEKEGVFCEALSEVAIALERGICLLPPKELAIASRI